MEENNLVKSFKNAFSGLLYCFRSQRNFRIHFLAAVLVLFLVFFLKVERIEALILFLIILFVLGVEMVNTALESIVDLVSKEYRKEAMIAKDVAAGVVLLGAIAAIIVGIIIFGPLIF